MTVGFSRQRQEGWCASRSYASIAALVTVVILLPACSGMKAYENSLAKNLHVRSSTDSGSWFSSVRAAVDIHRVGNDCATDYEGTVQLGESTTAIGIPPDRSSYLVFVFSSSSFWANRSGRITFETMLKPRSEYRYDAAVTYKNDMYHVAIWEFPPNQSTGRELDRQPLSACRSSSVKR